MNRFSMKFFYLLSAAGLLLTACSFDYGESTGTDSARPDIIMENIEYVRVRGGDPLVRFRAEYAERWEDRQTMELQNFTFEQLEDQGSTVNAEGGAAMAEVQFSSGDVTLSGGVRISIESEDITIRTAGLEWKDKDKILSGAGENEVNIERSDGTSFSGFGFSADIRRRSWNFSGEVRGTYVENEGGEESGGEGTEENSGESEGDAPAERAGREPGQLLPARRISN